MTDIRALCAELIDALDSGFTAGRIRMSPLVDRARAALTQPESATEESSATQPVDGNHFASVSNMVEPADGEVAELCVWLRANSSGIYRPAARAADLLERLAVPKPVPELQSVDIRYEFSVLDADCVEQAGGSAPSLTQALDEGRHYLASYEQDGPHTLELRRVEVLFSDHFPDTRKMVEPADGEVAELVSLIREVALVWEPAAPRARQLTRAADLLERLAVPESVGPTDGPAVPSGREPASVNTEVIAAITPIPVSDRLPGDQLCWWFESDEDGGYGSNWTLLRIRGSATGYTHWLPAHALPLPAGGGAPND